MSKMVKNINTQYKMGIIIPVYNSEQYLSKCLESIFCQIDNSVLVCCINDNSSDNSANILQKFSVHKNLLIINNYGDKHGPSVARNLGISNLLERCTYLTFIDSDDYVESNYIENLLKVEKVNCDVGCFSFFFAHADYSKKFAWLPNDGIYNSKQVTSELLEGKKILSQCWGKIYKSSLWNDIRFPEEFVAYEDYATLYKIFLKANQILIDNYAGYYYWLDNASTLRSSINNEKIIKGIEASLVPYLDESLDLDLKKASLQFATANYLMLLPRINKNSLTVDEENKLHFFNSIFKWKVVKNYVPLTKKDKKKKTIYLFSKHLYIYLYKYMINKKNK